jgi:hypothetical protein
MLLEIYGLSSRTPAAIIILADAEACPHLVMFTALAVDFVTPTDKTPGQLHFNLLTI